MKMFKRSIVFVIFFLLMASSALGESPFPLRGIKPGKMILNGHYDDLKAKAIYTLTNETHKGKPCFRLIWDTATKKINILLWPDGSPINTHYEKPKEGVVVEIDYSSEGANYKFTENGKTKTTKIRQKGLVEALAIDVLLMAFPFENRDKQLVFYGIDADSDDGDVYKLYVKIDDVETVQIQGKKIEAYKIKLGLKGFVGIFAPTFYFWYSAEPPHEYLKYEGPKEGFIRQSGVLAK